MNVEHSFFSENMLRNSPSEVLEDRVCTSPLSGQPNLYANKFSYVYMKWGILHEGVCTLMNMYDGGCQVSFSTTVHFAFETESLDDPEAELKG